MSARAAKLSPIPTTVPPNPRTTASARMIFRMNQRDAPSAFRIPISRVRCRTAMYIESSTTANPTPPPDTDHHVDEGAHPADVFDGKQRGELLHRVDVVVGQDRFQFRQHCGYVGGPVDFHEDLADLACISGEILQGPHGHGQAREFASFRYAGYVPAVVEDVGHLIPGMQLVLLRIIFVDDDVVETKERSAFQILEAAAHLVEASQIDPADEGYAGNRMHDHAQGQRHVGLALGM